jgi:uncharacterized coiled-coil protein SlyX
MIHPWKLLWLLTGIVFTAAALNGCTGDTAELQHRIAQLEKRLADQESDLKEVVAKLTQPQDFSADIQRIDDEQERMREIIRNQVEPVNAKLEEFRQWAQETQQNREKVAAKLAELESSLANVRKSLQGDLDSVSETKSSAVLNRKRIRKVAKDVATVEAGLNEFRAKLLETNTKLNNMRTALKEALPQWKERAVQDAKALLDPIEKRLSAVEAQAGSVPGPRGGESAGNAGRLATRIQELEEIIAVQKSTLLDLGRKVHQIETVLAR